MFQRFLAPSSALCSALFLVATGVRAQQIDTPVQLTIYNQDFAVARTSIPLTLRAGANDVVTTDVTSRLEPDSVVLRDPAGRHPFRVVEQNYDAGIVNQNWLLQKFEGKTIEFETNGTHTISNSSNEERTMPPVYVKGRIIRAGDEPLIEVDGHLQFRLPGTPVFPADTQGLLLKPTLRWAIESKDSAKFPAELDYITHGLSWQATYNVVVPEAADITGPERAEIVGWVSIQNNSGTDFPQATIQLMAGDVAKIRDMGAPMDRAYALATQSVAVSMNGMERVTQKEFDDFHLYDLHRTTALPNRETKQVQFLEVAGVVVQRSYQFNGNTEMGQDFYPGYHITARDHGNAPITHIAILQEIKNSESNHLGMPLPAGRLRLYRRETTGQMQFVGESMVTHTPAERTIQMVSGRAFDVTAERRQTDFHVDERAHTIDETFEVKVHSQKSQAVVVHDIEHLNRASNWQVTEKSSDFAKKDSSTIDFPISVPAKGDAVLTFSVHYSW